MSVDISVSITEDVVDIIATPTVNIVNVTNSASIDPGLYDLSEFTNTSPNPFVRASGLSSYVPTSRTITINGLTQDLSINRSWTIPATTWGTITGTLSAQTDLQTALNAKQNTLSLTTTGSSGASTLVGATLNVPNYTLSGLGGVPTSRTLTINGVTQDLSADRTFTISTGITIGSTAIASGVVGRVLFEGAGNVVQESANLFWDNTNGRLGIGTSSPSDVITLLQPIGFQSILRFQTLDNTTANGYSGFNCFDNSGVLAFSFAYGNPNSLLPNSAIIGPRNATGRLSFVTGSSAVSQITMFPSGNLLLQNGGTHTDAGFRLDVNGTARVSGNLTIATGFQFLFNNTNVGLYRDANTLRLGGFGGIEFLASAAAISSQTIRMKIFDTGNVGINTTTDAGFRLDVNGTVRVADNNQLGWGNGNYFIANNATPKIDCYVQSSLILTLGQSTMTFGVAATTRGLTASSDATFDFGGQFNRYRHGWLSGQLKVGDATAVNASAKVQIDSTTQGFLPPRMTTTQKNAIATPAAGLVVYDTTLNKLCVYTTAWETVTSL